FLVVEAGMWECGSGPPRRSGRLTAGAGEPGRRGQIAAAKSSSSRISKYRSQRSHSASGHSPFSGRPGYGTTRRQNGHLPAGRTSSGSRSSGRSSTSWNPRSWTTETDSPRASATAQVSWASDIVGLLLVGDGKDDAGRALRARPASLGGSIADLYG